METKDLHQLKAYIQKARRQSVNFAYSPNNNPKVEGVLMLHPRKKPKMLLVAVKKLTKNPKCMCGEMNIKSKDMTIQCIGKPPTHGLIRMMRKFLMSQKMTFKIHVLDESGNHIQSEGHDQDGVQSEDTSEEHAAYAAAEDSIQQQAMQAKLNSILIAITKKVLGALGNSHELDKTLKHQLGEIKVAVNAADYKMTQVGVKTVLDLIAQQGNADKKSHQEEVISAIRELKTQRINIEANLASLLSTLKNHQNSSMQRIAKEGIKAGLEGNASILKGHLNLVMSDIKTWGAAPSAKRDAVARKLSSDIATLNAHMNSNNLITLLEKNPLGVTVSIKEPISAALKQLEQKISA